MAEPNRTSLAVASPFLVGLLLIVGLAYPRTATPPAAGGQAGEAKKATPPASATGTALVVLGEALGLERAGGRSLAASDASLPPIDGLIVTVPDPVDSHLRYNFDRYLESVQRAMERVSLVLVRFQLPWQQRRKDDASASDSAFRREPGVLVFRGESRILVVWLVGETPTGGVQRLALRSALDQKAELGAALPLATAADRDQVRILGPAFSGTMRSLQEELRAWWADAAHAPPPSRLRLVSGGATAVDLDKLELPAGGTFQATVAPDREGLALLRGYLRARATASDERLALLVESNTGYGQEAVERSGGLRFFSFPSQISQTRSAYEKEKRASSGESASLLPAPTRARSLMVEEAEEAPVDVPPAFSVMASHSAELSLQRSLSAVAREGIRYVGLVATDVRDKLFLARQVRRHCPGVVIFTFGADVLYLHPEMLADLEGMLVVTPYPLFGSSQFWTYPFDQRHMVQFPSSTAQGVYNAALALLDQPGLLDYGLPFESGGRPPLWISVVGSDGLWPVTVAAAARSDAYVHSLPQDAGARPPASSRESAAASPESWEYVLMSFVLVVIVFCVAVLAQERSTHASFASPLLSRFDPLLAGIALLFEPFGEPAFEDSGRIRLAYLMTAFASLGAAYLVVLTVALPLALSMTGVALALAGILIAASALAISARVLPQLRRLGFGQAGVGEWTMRAVSFLVLALAAAFLLSSLELAPAQRFFFRLRAANLSGGLSPVPPLLFLEAAAFLWALCSMRRLRLLEVFHDGKPFLDFGEASFAGVDALEERVRMALSRRSLAPGPLLLGLGLVGAPMLRIFGRSANVLESVWFDRLFAFSFAIISLATVLNFFRFVIVWWNLRLLLRRLALHPLLLAFAKVPKSLSWTPMLDLTGQLPRFADLAVSAAYGRRIFDASKTPPEAALLEAERGLSRAITADVAGRRREAVELRVEVQRHLAELSALASAALERWWPVERPGPRAAAAADGSAPTWVEPAETFLATRVAGFVRHALAQMRDLAIFSTGSLLLILMAVSVYPFQAKSLLLLFCWSLIVGVVAATLTVFVQMDRDAVLSYLSGGDPGVVNVLNRGFLSRVAVHGLIPLLGLLAAQFPSVFRQVDSVLRPFLAGK